MNIYQLIFLVCLLLPLPLKAEDTHIIYGKDWKVEGYWKDRGGVTEKFDEDWRRDGFIRKESGEEFDERWGREGFIVQEIPSRDDRTHSDEGGGNN